MRRRVSGISLIEMLVALLIIAIGLLGVAGLQAYSLKNNTSAYHRSQANALIYDIFDAMRANRDEALQNQAYKIALSADPPTGTSRKDKDIAAWLSRLQQTLPSGDGQITCSGAAPSSVVCTVTVQWDDTRGQGPMQEMTVSMLL